MSPSKEFVQAISEDPDNDGLRLIFADWLEENGDPDRAEFIRVQIELAQRTAHYPPQGKFFGGMMGAGAGCFWALHWEPEMVQLAFRAGELLRQNYQAWINPLREVLPESAAPDHVIFERGLPAVIRLKGSEFLERGEELFQKAPIQHVHFSSVFDYLEEWADSPLLGRIRSICIDGAFRNWGLEVLQKAPQITQLKKLKLTSFISAQGVEALVAAPWAKDLVELDVRFGQRTRQESIEIFADAPVWDSLQLLRLESCSLGPEGARALSGSTSLKNLRTLDLTGNRLETEGLNLLASSGQFCSLQALQLSGNGILLDEVDLSAVGRWELQFLDPGHNTVLDVGAELLAHWSGIASLISLHLESTWITEPGWQALADSPHWKNLRSLRGRFEDFPQIKQQFNERFGFPVTQQERREWLRSLSGNKKSPTCC